ncbi:hypothetical protein DYB25_013143 [Aphanomyces astaci]|uniref:F-box domain-containing protein n=1 Tax=Aphanomyces astaci TaxID=112090 RepID=A0A397DLD5_APHAT|nr:hypothetical protein DYB36_006852 [Aphanomyces astaci]RHY01275.1 hypothetical protein DYB25_013143 [Aphanomyces astaci]RHY39843.1 hypothetical protein DYB38_010018 [Aphanomyces astaci]RHY45725.1 hypothetical protein DYB34_007259 [Aphanomyces astaci]RHY67365.1 hypothetical protein DYB30_000790 [Aphanomyces astaci]
MTLRDCRDDDENPDDAAHRSAHALSKSSEGGGIDQLDANVMAHLLQFLAMNDRVQLVSTCKSLAQGGVATKFETCCGACAPCVAGLQHLCTDAPERQWARQTWTSILRRHGHALVELHLVGCVHLSPDVFASPEVRRMLQHLRVLRIDMCPGLNTRSLHSLLATCENLRRVHIVNMPLDDAGLTALVDSNRRTLRAVDLTGCHLLVGSGLQALRGSQVEQVSLEGCHPRIAQCIAANVPTLEHLNMRYCYKLTDGGVASICASLGRLKTLDLSQCPRITDAAVRAISTSLPLLQHLKLWSCRQLTSTLTLPSLNVAGQKTNSHRHVGSKEGSTKWQQTDQVGQFQRQVLLLNQAQIVRLQC